MYKILLNRTENYYGEVTSNFKKLNFNEMLIAKGIKKLPSLKRVYKTLQSDRICKEYPNINQVAQWFGLSAMPSIDDDVQPNDWRVTIKYIEQMYGKKYAEGFERAEYPQLRKAA